MFWLSKLKSAEYNDLLQRFERLRIELEGVKMELELYKRKSRGRAPKEETDNNTNRNDPYGGVLLPESQ